MRNSLSARWPVVLAITAFAPVVSPVAAEEEIIVTASRLDQRPGDSGARPIILTREALEAMGNAFALDALSTLPGVSVSQNGSFGGTASLRLRGAASEQTLVLIDGVPVNDPAAPGGGFDFARLDTGAIERIEILKGPQSVLWGSDAIGGVVAITTRRAGDGPRLAAFAEAGSFETFSAGASWNTGDAGRALRLSAGHLESDGLSKADEANGNSEQDGYRAQRAAVHLALTAPGGARFDAGLFYQSADTAFDSFVFGAPGNVGDGDERTRTEESLARASMTLPAGARGISQHLMAGHSVIDRENFTDGQPGFAARGTRTTVRYQATADIAPALKVAAGAEFERTEADGEEAETGSLFALAELRPQERLTVTFGVRQDDHDRFGGEMTMRAGAAFDVSPSLTLRGGWGEGFKAPTLFQTTYICTFCGLTEPNRNLRPERSEGFEAGIDWRGRDGRAEAGLTWFRQDSTDLIDFSFTEGYDNIARVESEGVEVFGRIQIVEALSLDGNYTWTDAVDGTGAPRPRVPDQAGTVRLSFAPDGPFSGAVQVHHHGAEPGSFDDGTDAWTRTDLAARYRLSDRLTLSGRIENLFDAHYQQVPGYGTPGLSGSVRLSGEY